MSGNALAKTNPAAVAEEDGTTSPPTERELLVQIVKLQMQLNSKMFEFMREYQARCNFGESNIFSENSFRKPRVAKLRDEVNTLGVALCQVASVFIGDQLYEKRDAGGRILVHCRQCNKESAFVPVINSPYGMESAYVGGTERLICIVCQKDTLYPGDERLPKFSSVFKLE